MNDHVDNVLEQWAAERPDLDVSPMAIFGRLGRAHRISDAQLRRVFAKHGLDHSSFDVLATLRRNGPPYRLTPVELMRSAMITSGAISQRLERLETEGLITRTPSQTDRRGVVVALTDKGHALIDKVLPDHVDNEHRLLAGMSGPERAELADALTTLLKCLEASDSPPSHGSPGV